jgi:hypothetical protein
LLNSSARALAFYLGGGFALALLCATLFFDVPADPDATWQRKARRRAAILLPIGLAHPVLAVTAFALARDLTRAQVSVPLLLPLTAGSLVISLLTMTTVFVSTS